MDQGILQGLDIAASVVTAIGTIVLGAATIALVKATKQLSRSSKNLENIEKNRQNASAIDATDYLVELWEKAKNDRLIGKYDFNTHKDDLMSAARSFRYKTLVLGDITKAERDKCYEIYNDCMAAAQLGKEMPSHPIQKNHEDYAQLSELFHQFSDRIPKVQDNLKDMQKFLRERHYS